MLGGGRMEIQRGMEASHSEASIFPNVKMK